MSSLYPAQIGTYQITGPPFGGGMSVVYPAVQSGTNRVVALKVLASHLEHDATAVVRFGVEAQAAARLRHPNIVTVYEAHTAASPYYIAMEYMEGGTLADRLRNGPLPPAQTLAILRQVCAGLDHAHRHHVIHRDIKPANIMFDSDGRVAVTDFGIARVLDGSGLTMAGARTGTAEYMSIEQAKGEEADHRSDLYSLGLVAYEMLTGRVPLSAPQPLVTMRQIVNDPVPPPRTLNQALPKAVDTVLLKALSKSPQARYQSAAELYRALWEAVQPPPTDGGPRRRTAIIVASLLVVLALIAGLVATAVLRHGPGVFQPYPPTGRGGETGTKIGGRGGTDNGTGGGEVGGRGGPQADGRDGGRIGPQVGGGGGGKAGVGGGGKSGDGGGARSGDGRRHHHFDGGGGGRPGPVRPPPRPRPRPVAPPDGPRRPRS